MESFRRLQLYRCIEDLNASSEGGSNLGLVVGYSLAKSLLDFDPASYGREPRNSKEIWAIYQGLSDAAKGLKPDTVCQRVAGLKEEVNPRLTGCLADPDKRNRESNLLTMLIAAAQRRNVPIEELLRGIGSGISRDTLRQGLLTGAINRIYTTDYKLVEKVLSR